MVELERLVDIEKKIREMQGTALTIVNDVMAEIHGVIVKLIDANQKMQIDNFTTIQQLQTMNLNLQNRFLDVQSTMVDLTRDYKEVIRSIDKALRDAKENL